MLKKLAIIETAGVNDPSIFKAVFIAGGPGSGKSTVVDMINPQSLGMKIVNVDALVELLAGKLSVNIRNPRPTPEQDAEIKEMRDLAWKKNDKRLDTYIVGRLGLVIDGTGRDFRLLKEAHDKLAVLGYQTSMLFIDTSLDVAKARNLQRARVVPENVVEDFWHAVQANLPHFLALFGQSNVTVIPNSTPVDRDLMVPIWKDLQKYVNAPITNEIAKEWIALEKAGAGQSSGPVPKVFQRDDEWRG